MQVFYGLLIYIKGNVSRTLSFHTTDIKLNFSKLRVLSFQKFNYGNGQKKDIVDKDYDCE